MKNTVLQGLICCTTTASTVDAANQIADQLLQLRLAACVQIEGPITSRYRWKDADHCDEEYRDEEYRLTIKSCDSVWQKLKNKLVEIHPYDEPQITMFPIADTTTGYRQWVLDQVK